MVSISKKVFGLAGVATLFAGMAFGQGTCTQTSVTNIIRAEGTAEQVAPITINCTATALAAVGSGSLQVFLSPALPVTSKVLTTATGATEAVATITAAGVPLVAGVPTPLGTATQYNATVSGSTLNFSGLALPVTGTGAFTITISNVRVNATSLSVGSGVPPSISATSFISGSIGSVVPAALAAVQVSFAQNGLGASNLYTAIGGATVGSTNFVVCKGYNPTAGGALAFSVRVNENFAAAFKTAAGEASQVVTAPANAVANGTRIAVNFTNVPAGVALWVPVGPLASTTAGSASAISLTNTAAGTATVAVAPSTAANVVGIVGSAVALTAGSGTATFEVTAQDLNFLDKFDVPVYIVTSANGATPSTTGIGVSVNLSPTGSAVIPNFVVGSGTTTLTGSKFNSCTTSLLFPFVTNQLGFDTGLAISNTSTDPFGTLGATVQAGTCTLNFYGSGAPSPANVTTPNVPTGTTYTQVLSGVAAGFQGYVIAQCGFQYAHGFAFITNGVGTNGGLSQGYLAGVIPDVNQIARATGTGESLGN